MKYFIKTNFYFLTHETYFLKILSLDGYNHLLLINFAFDKKKCRIFSGQYYKMHIIFLIPVGLVIVSKLTFKNIRYPCFLNRKF